MMGRIAITLSFVLVAVTAVAQDAPAPAPAPAPEAAAPAAAPAPVDIRQIQLQAWISETNESGLRNVGANLNYTRFVEGVEQTGSVQQITSSVFNPLSDFETVSLPVPSSNPPSPFEPQYTNPAFPTPMRPDQNGGAAGIQTQAGFGLTATVIDSGQGTLDAVFRGIERKADGELISKPELLVINGKPATIKAGGKFPFQSVAYPKGQPQLSVAWRDLGVSLNVTPTILPDDMVKLSITQLDVTDIARVDNIRGVDMPVFSTRSQTGAVLVPDGHTIVIGGLSSRVLRKTERRVPILGRVPVLGVPFRSRSSEADIRTLLIFVSPTVVDLRNLTDEAYSALNFWKNRGSGWDNQERIEREIEAMENNM